MRSEWDKSWDDIKNIDAQWQVNLARSAGYLGARLDKTQDKQEAFIPYGSVPSIAGLNKAVRLSDNLTAWIFADPPEPEVVPSTGDDQDADSAEFGSRILADECSEGKLNFAAGANDAFSLAKDFGSGFLHIYVDPQGRGPDPVRIKAHPDAQSEDDPLLDSLKQQGQEVEDVPPVLKFVTQDGGLSDDRYAGPLKQQFLPKLCMDVLTGRHVRFLSGTSRDIWDAQGVLIGAMVPLGTVKASFEDVRHLSNEDLSSIVSYRPSRAKDLLPVEQRRYLNETKIADDTLVFLLMRYHLPTTDNPHGSYFAAVGDKVLAYYGEWWDTEHDERLDLPVTQFKQYKAYGNPYGSGSMERLGPGNELLALILDSLLQHLDRFGDSKTFVPTVSNLRPEQLEAETHRYLPVAPNGIPVNEEIPDFPQAAEKMYAILSAEMDAESRLQQAGQAQQTPNVTSARHFQANLQQVSVLLSDLRQHTQRGLERGYRIALQLIRAYYSVPQMLSFEGEDGSYYQEEFSGVDLRGFKNVRISAGTFSQNLPEQKAALAKSLYLEDKALSSQEYRRIVMSSFNPALALSDDPHFKRVKRQIGEWKKGPPDGWAPQMGVDQTGQPVPDVVNDPILGKIFHPLPCDDDPRVAMTRVAELERAMASARLEKFPTAWNQGLAMAYLTARQNAGIVTVAQQQQAAAQAQAGQQQANQAKVASDQIKAHAEIQKANIDSATTLAEAKLRAEGQVLDVKAAEASNSNPVPA